MTKKRDEWIFMDEAAEVAGCSKSTIYAKMKDEPGNCQKLDTTGKRGYGGFRWQVRRSWAERLEVGVNTHEVARLRRRIAWLESRCGLSDNPVNEGARHKMMTMYDAAALSKCSVMTIRRWIKAGKLTRHEEAPPAKGGSPRVLVDREELFTLLADRNQGAQKFATVNGTTSEHKAQIEGLKTRLKAAEKERDQAITARDKWAKDHARQKKEIEALKLELQTYADTYAESKPPAVIDRLVSAVESAPLQTLMQIDQPRHAALRRVVGLWTAVQHAVESFTPGDSAQTNNDD